MIRVIYRWHVQPGAEDAFVSAWMQGTQAIRDHIKGAQGSILLRSHDRPAEFIAVARWESLADWQAFASAKKMPDAQASERLAAVSTLVSTEVGDEILDLVEECYSWA